MVGFETGRGPAPPARVAPAAAQITAIATAVSRRRPRFSGIARPAAPDRGLSVLARASLCLLTAMIAPSCLVTASPSFEEPERTPPFLLGPSALPDSRLVTVVDMAKLDPVEFSATVRSEDNGVKVQGRLVLDYGVKPPGGPPGVPYRQALSDPVLVEASTLDDTTRRLTAFWFPGSNKTTVGCHNVTLFATHEIDFNTGCPSDSKDFDYLSWTVITCDSTQAPCCDPTLPPEQGGCQSFLCPRTDPNARCDVAAATGPDAE
jgi:hypothetical protein